MAHSTVENAGQKYASARKQGVTGRELVTLRSAAFGGRISKKDDDTVSQEKARVNQLVAAANNTFHARSSYHYY